MKSLLWWVLRRRVGVGPGDVAIGYSAERLPLMIALAGVLVLETAVVGLLVPWPVVHVLDVCAVFQVLVVVARWVTRPHLLRPDALVLRYGTAFEAVVPLDVVAAVRVRRRHHTGYRSVRRDGDEVSVVVGDQTTVLLELAEPVDVVLPGGDRCAATALSFHADDPAAAAAMIGGRASACAPG
ncbi:MAG: hypothetical protein ABIQ18_31440 [Umezawaea sp.]